jgi:hypothetical protein
MVQLVELSPPIHHTEKLKILSPWMILQSESYRPDYRKIQLLMHSTEDVVVTSSLQVHERYGALVRYDLPEALICDAGSSAVWQRFLR